MHRIRRHLLSRVHGVSPPGVRKSRNLDFGVMALPAPDDGMKGKLPYTGAQPWMGISSQCEHPEAAAKYLMALYSEDYQAGLVEDGGFVSVIDSVNESVIGHPAMLEYYQIDGGRAALSPDPIVANPETAAVVLPRLLLFLQLRSSRCWLRNIDYGQAGLWLKKLGR